VPAEQSTQPLSVICCPGEQVSEQGPQSTVAPQLFVWDPHLPAQVVSGDSASHGHRPSKQPSVPQQTCPGAQHSPAASHQLLASQQTSSAEQ